MPKMKYKEVGVWQIKVKDSLEVNKLLLDCFTGKDKEKINHFAWLFDSIGRIRTLEGGKEIHQQVFNDFVTFGIWLRENDLVKLNVKVRENMKVKEKPSMFG